MKRKRTAIIEYNRIRITASPALENFLFCPVCGTKSVFISEAETIALLNVLRMQRLFIKVENLHSYQPDASRTLVCLSSIINSSGDF